MPKLKVLKPFRDKVDKKTWYKPGQMISIADEERAKDLIDRELCAEVKGKQSSKTSKSVGSQQPSEGAADKDAQEEQPEE